MTQDNNPSFGRSKVSAATTDAAKNHARAAIEQSRKIQEFVQQQVAQNEKTHQNPAITAAAQAAQEYSRQALDLSQESLRYAEQAANSEGEASHQAFEQAVKSHVEAAKAQSQANKELYKINQQHLQATQKTNPKAEGDESAASS